MRHFGTLSFERLYLLLLLDYSIIYCPLIFTTYCQCVGSCCKCFLCKCRETCGRRETEGWFWGHHRWRSDNTSDDAPKSETDDNQREQGPGYMMGAAEWSTPNCEPSPGSSSRCEGAYCHEEKKLSFAVLEVSWLIGPILTVTFSTECTTMW